MLVIGYLLVIPAIIIIAYYLVTSLIDMIYYAVAGHTGVRVLLSLILFIVGVLFINVAKAETFEYKDKLVIEAPDYKTAAKLCFKKLNPVFVTEEKALDAIDICVNLVKGEVK